MTVQEVLKSVRFDDITDELVRCDSWEADNLYSFKYAFDHLCLMQPHEDNVNIPVEIIERKWDYWLKGLGVYIEERGGWNTLLSRQVCTKSVPNATLQEIATALLLEITEYGFSEEEYYGHLILENNEKNPYAEKYRELGKRYFDITNRCISGYYYLSINIEHERNSFRQPRKNGPKRHRERRIKISLEALERKVRRWDLWFMLKTMSGMEEDIAERLLQIIITGSPFKHYYMESWTAGDNDIDYITDLIINYFPAKKGSKSIVLVTASSRFYNDNNDNNLQQSVWEAFGSFLKLPYPKYIWATNENRQNIRVDILVFE